MADDKYSVTKMMISVFDRVENFVEKKKNSGYKLFLCFPQCFQKSSDTGLLEVVIIWLGNNRVENLVGRGENAGYQYFLLFPHCLEEIFFSQGY